MKFAAVAIFALVAATVAAQSSLTITNCSFKNLHAGQGAAVSVKGAVTVSVNASYFEGLSAQTAGAIYATKDATLNVMNSVFWDVTSTSGAAVYVATDATITGSAVGAFTFENNYFIGVKTSPAFYVPDGISITGAGNKFINLNGGVADGVSSAGTAAFTNVLTCNVAASDGCNDATITVDGVTVCSSPIPDSTGCPNLSGRTYDASCGASNFFHADACGDCAGTVTDATLCPTADDGRDTPAVSGPSNQAGTTTTSSDSSSNDNTAIIAAVVAAVGAPAIFLILQKAFGGKGGGKKRSSFQESSGGFTDDVDLDDTASATYSLDSAGTMDSLQTAA